MTLQLVLQCVICICLVKLSNRFTGTIIQAYSDQLIPTDDDEVFENPSITLSPPEELIGTWYVYMFTTVPYMCTSALLHS